LVDNHGMPSKRARLDTTPAGQLVEAGLQRVLGYQLALASVTTSLVFESTVGATLDLGRVEFTLLMLIGENPGCTSSRLAQALNVTAPNITQWIERLVKRGWVQRDASATDRRANHLQLTEEGAALATSASQRVLAGEAQALAQLSPAEHAILLELLHKVACSRARVDSKSAAAPA
jgi:DNA-binding MarR family transcriptional regulator